MFVVIYYNGKTPHVWESFTTENKAREEAKRVIRSYGKVSIGKVEIISTGEQTIQWQP